MENNQPFIASIAYANKEGITLILKAKIGDSIQTKTVRIKSHDAWNFEPGANSSEDKPNN